jgi:hypothetical protein
MDAFQVTVDSFGREPSHAIVARYHEGEETSVEVVYVL